MPAAVLSGTAGRTSTTAAAVDGEIADDGLDTGIAGEDAESALESFLDVGSRKSVLGSSVVRLGSAFSIAGVVSAAGVMVFLWYALWGAASEVSALVGFGRAVGSVAAIGALAVAGGSLVETGQVPGVDLLIAVVLRFGGGIALALFFSDQVVSAEPVQRVDDELLLENRDAPTWRWEPLYSDLAVGGAALAVLSFAFDGHTASKGSRLGVC